MDEGRCKSCGVAIVFITTPSGAQMPCDKKRISIVTIEGRIVQGWAPHWGSCPSAATHRKPHPTGSTKADEPDPEDAKNMFRQIRAQLGDDDKSEEE